MRSKIIIFAIASVLGLSSTVISAQTTRKAKPLATPLPVLTGAEIISRADDYQDAPAVTSATKKGKAQPAVANPGAARRKDLDERVKKLETKNSDYDDQQRRLLTNIDILTRAEQRSESLRKQMFEMIEKESSISSRLDQIDLDLRPENIERALQVAGSMKPEEVRENRRKSLEAEQRNLQNLLTQVQRNRAALSDSVEKADQMVQKLRTKLEKDIDDSLADKPDKPE